LPPARKPARQPDPGTVPPEALAAGTPPAGLALQRLVPRLEILADPVELAARLDPVPAEVPGVRAGERAAAVLLALRPGLEGVEILLLRRAAHLDQHAGQIGFPGGRLDPGDAGPREAALREACEEVGLSPAAVRVLGALRPLSVPVSRHRVLPLVGWLPEEADVRVGSEETAECWFTSLALLARTAVPAVLRGRPAWEFPLPGARVWGMSALVLGDLFGRTGR
jgi:8-oxo-dGTP pyrophosphatase MutT (NUDIX family)